MKSYAFEGVYDRKRISVGDFTEIFLVSAPVIYEIFRKSDGSVEMTTEAVWKSHNISEMQVCFSFDTPCQPSGNWIPVKMLPRATTGREEPILKFVIYIGWVGPRTLWLAARFRDKNGNPIPSVSAYSAEPKAIARISLKIDGIWDEATQVEALPPRVQTAIAATRVAFPLTGSVTIEEGRCCVGGLSGQTLQVRVDFSATSPFGKVKGMRVRSAGVCFAESEMTSANWEPFTSPKTYPEEAGINWHTFYVSVQYRDEYGNLSRVSCDDIRVEGNDPIPTSMLP